MIYSKVFKAALFFPLFTLCFATVTTAQQQVKDTFTDEEYETFVAINQTLVPMQADVEAKMVAVLDEKGMEAPRFQELMQAQRQGNIMDATDDAAEIALFNEAGQEIIKIQRESQQELQKQITDKGMKVQKFQEMSIAYNQNPKVKEKVDEMIAEQNQ
jgi:hypothetical protein